MLANSPTDMGKDDDDKGCEESSSRLRAVEHGVIVMADVDIVTSNLRQHHADQSTCDTQPN
jgi:hypothetical protein